MDTPNGIYHIFNALPLIMLIFMAVAGIVLIWVQSYRDAPASKQRLASLAPQVKSALAHHEGVITNDDIDTILDKQLRQRLDEEWRLDERAARQRQNAAMSRRNPE